MYYIELSDKRNSYIYNELKELKFNCKELNFNNIKLQKDDVLIFSPAKKFNIDEITLLPSNIVIFGGKQSDEVLKIIESKSINYINLLKDETFAIQNAKLTTEGILSILINNTERSIFENKILILGCGRIGKATSLLFNKLNLNYSISTFKFDDVSNANLFTTNLISSGKLKNEINKFDVIINTVPYEILTDDILNNVSDSAIIIEVASVSCLNLKNVNKYKFKYIPAPKLPQVYCPISAANIMLKSIMFTNTKEL